jgi:hypothetical protein
VFELSGVSTASALLPLFVCFFLFEAVVLFVLWQRRGCGIPPWQMLANLGSGGCLALALITALHWQHLPLVFALVTGSLFFHLFDLASRWQR